MINVYPKLSFYYYGPLNNEREDITNTYICDHMSFMIYELATKKPGFFLSQSCPQLSLLGGLSSVECGLSLAVHMLLLFCHSGSGALTGSAATAHRLPEHMGSGAKVADLAASQHVGS